MSRNCWLWLALLATTPALAQSPLQKGDEARKQFDIKAAVTAYRVAYREHPDNYEAAWKLVRALADQGTLANNPDVEKQLYLEAEPVARAAVKLQPRDSAGHTSLAIAIGKQALFEGGQHKVELSKEIKDEVELAIKLNPRDDIAYHILGVWNREMVQLNWALRQVAQLLYGKFPPASLDNATAYLQKAVEISPGNVANHVELGDTYIATRQWEKADAELVKALSLPKSWVTDEHYKARATESLKRVKEHLD